MAAAATTCPTASIGGVPELAMAAAAEAFPTLVTGEQHPPMLPRVHERAGLPRRRRWGGARGIVASLWPVDDASTSVRMKVFYGELAQVTPRAQPLRAAQLAVLTDPDRRHPCYWAPFVVVGDWR